MSVTVTVETGSGTAGANSYASVADGDAYFAARPRSTGWTALATDAKGQYLIQAARLLDRSILWAGLKDAAANTMEWPRYVPDCPDETPSLAGASIDQWLKDAQFELALSLIATDLTEEPALRGIRKLSVGNGAVEIEADPAREVRLIPRLILDMVAPYGNARQGSGTTKLIRG